MSDINQKSVAEWEALEKTKRGELKELNSRKALAEAQRADLILLIGEMPNDKTVKKNLETIEKTRKDLALEIESIEALLKVIPERLKFSRAREIEEEITVLENFDAHLVELMPAVDAAAEGFAQAVGEYYAELESLRMVDPISFHIPFQDIPVKTSLGAALEKHGLKGKVNIGDFRNPQPIAEAKNPSRIQISGRVHRMREVAKSLRGEAGAQEYCPNCYGKLVLSYEGDPMSVNHYTGSAPQRRICKDCGWEAQ